MNVQKRFRQLIDQQQDRLRAAVPGDRQAAILALIRAQDHLPLTPGIEPPPDLITGRRLANPGGNMALQLCLESTGGEVREAHAAFSEALDCWAASFLGECGQLAEARLLLAHCETGFMRLTDDGNGTFDAWIARKRAPASWRERADIDWWASWLGKRHEPEMRDLRSGRPDADRDNPGQDAYYRRLAKRHLKMMTYQLGYPPAATIGGCTVQVYLDVLGWLIGWVLHERDNGQASTPRRESSLVATIASGLGIHPDVIAQAVAAFTLGRENAAWHAAVPGVTAAPLVRLDPDWLVPSAHGLTTEPLLFLTRELRRRDAQEYHNTAYLREDVFRQDLYALFGDKRFVTSTGRVQLRRDAGNVRTDIDAVIFDRKTGTLGVFELKSQDPFARSANALDRQRDNMLYANRQISGVLAWLKQHGPDALLSRVDARTAKKFRAHKVYPFVLGRYVAHFSDGPEPDRRAAWGTWPRLLRLLDGGPVRATDANPIASLFTRLANDDPSALPAAGSPREIAIGTTRITVHPSYATYQASAAVPPVSP